MASTNFPIPSSPIFSGENYPIWTVKMRTYLRAYDLCEVLEVGAEVNPLPNNPTIGQIKNHREEVSKNFKALSCIQLELSEVIFARVMVSETVKEAWDKLKEEFYGNDKIRMKDSETIEEFSNKLIKVVNQIRLMREELTDSRIVEKVLVSLPELFEAKISSLEDSKDLTKLSPSELVHALQAQEQRRSLRLEEATEIALQAKFKGKRQIVKKKKNNQQTQKANISKVEEQEEFVFTMMEVTRLNDENTWFLDSGCTQHMTSKQEYFTKLESAKGSVKLADKTKLEIVGNETVAIETPKAAKK
ncbi:uncharacterized protein LOC107859945 [Capsicum annuum]|uniref:uncharacterized protein LOC107859945 n=1 Tax=Capsicum annuum TaxID=4072 RepID=UPI0007BF94A4|nr:uncharacterized protein LOC107859945 [Capsicum annuum]